MGRTYGNNCTQIGGKGEDLACKWLADNGFEILERNWRCGHLEIDIIAVGRKGESPADPGSCSNESYASQFSAASSGDRRYIHFIGGKMRKAGAIVSPVEAVNRRKREVLIMAAEGLIKSHHIKIEALFDILAITYSNSRYSIEFIEGAFAPCW